ncbi:Transcriptional regulator, LysR family [Labilithrix luteola]|uniref:Transcriptional regulator, LysR family n=1 Tax=Labilithrix luteola TaxID=1391654 RepID=A0A0K1PQC3_9BACT|nr:LysR family transcriptional regulator [Labilithrix luteola]AKU95717.1 Transcriptional regulator, LysR family [Labilithrix luteola]
MGIPGEGARLENYEAFIAIVDTGNLTRAAARLKRSLQSISRSLTALEEHLGVELVRRTTRLAQPTDAGLAFYRRISVALNDIAGAEADLREVTRGLSGSIGIAASAFFAAEYLVPAILEFSKLYPAVEFDLRISETFTDSVSSGVDVMIRIGRLPASPLKARKIASLRRVVVASPAYVAQYGRPESPAELAHHSCIVRSSAQDAKAWTFHGPDGTSERVAVSGKVTTDNSYVVKHAMLSGLGIAVAPFFQFREAVEAGHAEILLGDFTLPQIPVHAVWPASPKSPARVRRFVDLLEQRLKKELT